MDLVMVSRLQFAVVTMFHFLFVPLTLGLSVMIAYMETQYVTTKNEVYLQMTKFWGKIFLLNFAIGVVTGITLEFQFGTNWAKYSTYVGDIFGPILAIEATLAFFLESTFIGIWVFGWEKLSSKLHAIVAWIIAIAGIISAFWILVANGWMQHPVGYIINNNRAELVDFVAVITNKFAILEFFHTVPASFLLASFFVMGISSFHLLKGKHISVFYKSFKIALAVGFFSSILVVIIGDIHGGNIAKVQPSKLAAMEAVWDTQERAPLILFAVPDEKNEKNIFEFGKIPAALSWLCFHDINAEIVGLKDFLKQDRPPILLTFIVFRVMVVLGFLFIFLTSIGILLRNNLLKNRLYLKIMLCSIPLPYVAIEMGWMLTEIGRQPWIVYGLLRTSDAVSSVIPSQVCASLIAFVFVYTVIGLLGIFLIIKIAAGGPEKTILVSNKSGG